ncbi:hypothetical protein V2S66_18670 [Streptomyces sp. V4-01]|uniref:Uncharacterized protein n=1 Tax=Actinacidiphila polyblastidii TaxID=3110430 RepID=A0ABU7PDY3_9ACTN|nr:hypothetical protein [Streptomyces sp. V4-01]
MRRKFDQIAATALHLSPYDFDAPLREATPDPAPAQPASETGEDFLPPSLRARGQRQYKGRMMRFAGSLEIDGTVRTCPQCGVDRDWLVLCSGLHIWLRCRSAHETYEPALNSTWYDGICGPIGGTFSTKDEGVTKEGFDGTFSGITFPE